MKKKKVVLKVKNRVRLLRKNYYKRILLKKFSKKLIFIKRFKRVFDDIDIRIKKFVKGDYSLLSRHLTDEMIYEVIYITKYNFFNNSFWWSPVSLDPAFNLYKRTRLLDDLSAFFVYLKKISLKKLKGIRISKKMEIGLWRKLNYNFIKKVYHKKYFMMPRLFLFYQNKKLDLSLFFLKYLFLKSKYNKKFSKRVERSIAKMDRFLDKREDREFDYEEKFLKFALRRGFFKLRRFARSWKNYGYFNKPYSFVKIPFVPRFHILTLQKSVSNFFITINNPTGKLLSVFSIGLIARNNSKKTKVSPMLVNPIMYRVKDALTYYRINRLIIHVKCKITTHVFNVLRFLAKGRTKFRYKYIAYLRPMPHHFGQRTKKARRL